MGFSNRILVVDDDASLLDLVEDVFAEELPSFDVLTATDVDAAFDALHEVPVECIVSDIRMPSTDGLTFLELVRDDYPDVPFVVFTARGSEEIAGDAVFKGATDYIQKRSGTSRIRLLAKRVSSAIETYRTERRLARLQRRYETVSRTATDGFWEWDDDRDVLELSDGFQRLFGFDTAIIEDASEWWRPRIHPDDRDRVLAEWNEAFSSPVSVSRLDEVELPNYEDEFRFLKGDGEYAVVHVRAAVVGDDGTTHVVGTSTDVTERHERAAALRAEHRRFRAIFEKSFDAMVLADDDGRYVDANAQACDLFGLPYDELVGRSIADFAPDGFEVEDAWESFQTNERDRGTFPLVRPDGERRYVEYAATSDVLPGQHLSVLRDVTERVRTRSALLQHQAVVERMSDVAYILDPEFRFVYVNRAFCDLLDRPRSTILGRHLSEFVSFLADPDEFLESHLDAFVDVLEGRLAEASMEIGVDAPDGARRVVDNHVVPYVTDGEVRGVVGVARDVTDRVAAEADLRATNELLEGVISASPVAIMTLDPEGRIERWNHAAEETFGWTEAEVRGERPPMIPDEAEDQFETRLDRLRRGESFTGIELERVRRDGTPMYLRISTAPLTDADGDFAGTVALVSDVTEMKEREARLAEQRNELDRLNRLNTLVRDINRDLVQASTTTEVEQVVCNRFASHPPCRLAWIGGFDRRADEVVPRRWAGIENGFLDEVTATVPDSPTPDEPVGSAVRTGSVQFVDDVRSLSTSAKWRSAALDRGYRSLAAIPLVYNDLEYGVLVVYGGAPGAFAEEDEAVFAELGETVAYALNAEERARSLVTNGVVELTFRIHDSTEFFSRLSAFVGGELTLERVSLRSDGACRFIVAVDGDDSDALDEVTAEFDVVESVTLINGSREENVYELTTSDAFVAETLANHGGLLSSLTADDGTVELQVELPATADVRSVVTAVQEAYPDAELRAQHQREAGRASVGAADFSLTDLMTERQREALETAYFAGYYDTPRANSGVDIAEMLGISQPTFHQHLRAGQNRLFSELLE